MNFPYGKTKINGISYWYAIRDNWGKLFLRLTKRDFVPVNFINVNGIRDWSANLRWTVNTLILFSIIAVVTAVV